MKSMDELREEIRILKQNDIDTDELVRIAEAIEREVEECYVELLESSTPIYVNPNQIVCVFQDAGDYPHIVLGNGGRYTIKQESYDRIVAWIERHDG